MVSSLLFLILGLFFAGLDLIFLAFFIKNKESSRGSGWLELDWAFDIPFDTPFTDFTACNNLGKVVFFVEALGDFM